MKKLLFAAALFFATSATVWAQGIELGIRAGGTFTSGRTELPAAQGVQVLAPNPLPFGIPALNNSGNGAGTGFVAGVYGRLTLPLGFFVQAEVDYVRIQLNQKVDAPFAFTTVVPVQGVGNVASEIRFAGVESTTNAAGFNIPLHFGKSFAGGLVRAYLGPNFLFLSSAEQKADYEYVGATGALAAQNNQLQLAFSETRTDDLTQPTLDPNRQVLSFIVGVEVGVGVNLPVGGLGVDLRYSVPAITGVYENKDIKGFLGITSLTVSKRLFKLGM
ncbi:outer membrane beta-barrel protein [Eisenibacter elegans]|uniref:outer membrane beta-barrel protein n=1 Tax=Eisenibacter elegans TaxID=997 RepID=UPI0003F63427|nr:outer membrane beta-barrel protein [Eisenibacter elegans]